MATNNILESVGNTPLLKLQHYSLKYANSIFMKMEALNPGGSHKIRIALNMIEDAESRGILIPNSGQTLIEGTGGNTGLGLLMAANIKGYNVILVVPDNYSDRKKKLLRLFGATVIESDSASSNNSHGELVQKLIQNRPEYIWLNQQKNLANPNAHYLYTGQEIIKQLQNKQPIDYMVAGMGSGGHISGIGRALKEVYPNLTIIGVEPEGCNLKNDTHRPHKIQGLSVGLIPDTLDLGVVDDFIHVCYDDCINKIHELAQYESISAGISSAANIAAIHKLSSAISLEGKNVLTFCYDNVDSYLDEI